MDIRPIRNDDDHEAALHEIASLWDAKPGTKKHDRLEVLAILVAAYEAEHYPVEPLDPITALKTFMTERGLSRKDLVPAIGSRSRVTEVLNRKRPLNLAMIRRLRDHFGLPAEVLIGPGLPESVKPAKRRTARASSRVRGVARKEARAS